MSCFQRVTWTFMAASLFFCHSRVAWTQVLSLRIELIEKLGANSQTEDFESILVGDGQSETLDVMQLNSNTAVNGFGPGLVQNGLTFRIDGSMGLGEFLWIGSGVAGNPTRAFRGSAGNGGVFPTLTIGFTPPVQAMGFDLFRDSSIFVVEVLDTQGQQLFLSRQILDDFFGYAHSPGIGSVKIGFVRTNPTIAIDNLTFGLPVPEPSTQLLALLGLLQCVCKSRVSDSRSLSRDFQKNA